MKPPPLNEAAIRTRPALSYEGLAGTGPGPDTLAYGHVWPGGAGGDEIEALLPAPLGDLFVPYVAEVESWVPGSPPPGSTTAEGAVIIPLCPWWPYLSRVERPVELVRDSVPPETAALLQLAVERKAEGMTAKLDTSFTWVARALKVVVAEIETGTGKHPLFPFDPERSLRAFRSDVGALWRSVQDGTPGGAVLEAFDRLADGWALVLPSWARQRSLLAWQLHVRDGYLDLLCGLRDQWASYDLAASGIDLGAGLLPRDQLRTGHGQLVDRRIRADFFQLYDLIERDPGEASTWRVALDAYKALARKRTDRKVNHKEPETIARNFRNHGWNPMPVDGETTAQALVREVRDIGDRYAAA